MFEEYSSQKEANKHGLVLMVLLLIAFLTASLAITYAIFHNLSNNKSEVKFASWKIDVNGVDITKNKEFPVNEFKWKSTNTKDNMISPGSTGIAKLTIKNLSEVNSIINIKTNLLNDNKTINNKALSISLDKNNFVLEKNKSISINVEIKWLNLEDNDSLDTYIGENINNLNVYFDIFASQINSTKIIINNDYDIYNLEGENNKNTNIFNGETITPGSSGIYHFNVLNNHDEDLNYKLKFKEENKNNISMKYKLKLNGNYLTNDWIYLKDIKFNNKKINTNEFDVYELEWKWFNSDNDSKVTENSSYKINIIVDSNGIKKNRR